MDPAVSGWCFLCLKNTSTGSTFYFPVPYFHVMSFLSIISLHTHTASGTTGILCAKMNLYTLKLGVNILLDN